VKYEDTLLRPGDMMMGKENQKQTKETEQKYISPENS
jgi:hypothetical protein